ncbi:MAG: rod shape-determining protein MreC [Aerococcus sp.]|nr:rod shape-determining protein MreC [Aerococcus sp.]
MRQFFENKRLIVLLLSVITSLSLMAFSIFGNQTVPEPLTWVNDVTAMIGRVVSSPANTLMDFGESVVELKNTYQENQSLKKQINSLQELKAQNQQLKVENEELNHLLDLEPTLVGKTIISSTVISRSPNEWLDTLTIDVGSNNGIKKDMSVMSDTGLIGRVYEVGATSSKVRLLTSESDEHLAVAAGIQSGDDIIYGVVSAYDKNADELVIDQVSPDAKIKKDSIVTTNGLGGVSPEGLIVGKVVSTSVDNFGLSQQVRVKPGADFNSIRHVFVVMTAGNKNQENDSTGRSARETIDTDSTSDSSDNTDNTTNTTNTTDTTTSEGGNTNG